MASGSGIPVAALRGSIDGLPPSRFRAHVRLGTRAPDAIRSTVRRVRRDGSPSDVPGLTAGNSSPWGAAAAGGRPSYDPSRRAGRGLVHDFVHEVIHTNMRSVNARAIRA